MIRVWRHGAHSHRMPVAYPALAPLFEGRIAHVDRPEAADLHLFAHVLDIAAAPREMVEDWRRRRRPVVLLSEEPFWDTIWGRRPLDRIRPVETAYGALPVIQLNHATSPIFAFDRIPYYLLTNHRFATAYRARFTANAGLSPADWRRRFAARAVDTAFMFERRPEPYHGMAWPGAGLFGLCAWRTELAEAMAGPGTERLGQSWQGGRTRFELANWHLDKLVDLDGRARILAGLENTHHPDYLTEKIFDAFACGSLPLYLAEPRHRLHELALPEGSWLNLAGLSPEAAADRVRSVTWEPARFEAFAEAQAVLARLFSDTGLWVAERHRLGTAVVTALDEVLEDRPAPVG